MSRPDGAEGYEIREVSEKYLFSNSRRFFRGCFVIMMLVKQIGV
jgi:hypothetical protein